MIIYQVYNKVSTCLFESKEDAEAYLNIYGTASNGLTLCELFVFDDSKQAASHQADPADPHPQEDSGR